MGDTFGDGGSDEKPIHEVKVNSFYMSKYQVTQELYQEIIGKNPSHFKGRNMPVEHVSWYDAIEFCNKLSEQEGLKPCYLINKNIKDPNNKSDFDDVKWQVECDWSANGYRLPTEAEWEYAAREGGVKVRFGNGKDIAKPGEINFDASKDYKKPYSEVGNYPKKTTPVGKYSPNKLGLYDMSGNVEEWCWDWYASDYYKQSPKDNPKGAKSGEYRLIHGGSWYSLPGDLRCSFRRYFNPNIRSDIIGFRMLRAF